MDLPVEVDVASTSNPDAGDFAGLYRDHRERAMRLAYLLSGDVHRAEDAVAQAFANVYARSLRASIADPGAYVRRAVVNELRTRGRRRALERREERRSRVLLGPASVEETMVERDRLLGALARLPARQRTAVVLRFYEDLSEADTAAVLGVSVGTVKSTVSRGLSRLRYQLGEG